MKNNLYKAILLGAIWGFFEATVGYLLHLSSLRIGSMIWFPVAYYFCHTTYKYTQSAAAVMLTAFIASSLKLINLFFPGRVDTVINPAVSIILEAMAVVLVYHFVLNKRIDRVNPLSVMLTGFVWRSLYVCYILSMPQSFAAAAPFATVEAFLEFMFVKNIINIAIISAGFYAAKAFGKHFGKTASRLREAASDKALSSPALAAGSIMLTIAAQIFIR